MNIGEPTVLLIKAKDMAEGHEVNMIVSAFCHPMYLISFSIIEVGGVELS
jgi:hypothetical protein